MKWDAYRNERESRYVIHAEVDTGNFVFHRYGTLDELTLQHGSQDTVFKMAIAEMSREISETLHRIRGTHGHSLVGRR
jgi:hypothetical protein